MIITNVENLRDPFILVENDAYYMYGTNWKLYKNTSSSLDGIWVEVKKEIVVKPEDFIGDIMWAPEVYKYNNEYYMFTTYKSSKNNLRGCATFKSSSPEGPFKIVSNGHFTPSNWSAIDATLYIDKNNQPWCVFVHEHCSPSIDDKIGRMAIAKLSRDLTKFISEPIEIFRADDPKWTDVNVTDGCFMYETKNGKLLMIWSNYKSLYEYCIAVAQSDNNKIDGKWLHYDYPIFSRELNDGIYDGGHGMIFSDRDGQKYMSLHSPNYIDDKIIDPKIARPTTSIIVKIKEENDVLSLEL